MPRWIKEGTITGTLKLAIQNANAQAKFGNFVDVDIVNATGEADVSLGVQFKDFRLNGDDRITFGELLDNITSPEKFAKVTFAGSAHVKLPIEVNPNILGNPSASQAAITIDWPDFTDPNTLKFSTENFDAIADLQNFSFDRLFSALQSLSKYLSQIEGFSFLNQKLPLVNESITELLGTAAQFASALQGLQTNPAKSLQFVSTTLEQLLHLPTGSVTLSLPKSNELELSLLFTKNFTAHQNLDLELGDLVNVLSPNDPARNLLGSLTHIVQVDGSGQLDLDLGATLELDLGWDLTPDPTNNGLPDLVPFLYNTTSLRFTAKAAATHINFTTAVGPISIGIKDGSASILKDCAPGTTDPAAFVVKLKDTPNGRHLLSELDLDAIDLQVNAGACATLPVFIGNDATLVGNIVFTINSLPAFFQGEANSVVLTVPDFSSFFQNFDFFDHLDLIVDGIDYLLSQVQSGLDSGVFSTDLPLIGDGLAKAADQGVHFIDNIRQGILTQLKQLFAGGVNKDVSLVKQALFNALGPGSALNVLELTDVNKDGKINADDIDAPVTRNAGSLDSVQFNLTLGKTITLAQSAINFNIGIPALGLSLDGGVSVTLDFLLKLRFGVSRTAGFYLDTSQPDEIKLDVKASTPNLQAHGRLGFMQMDASDDSTNPSNVHVQFVIDIKKPNPGTGPDKDRLTFDDILRAPDIEQIFAATLSGGASVRLNLLSTFGNDGNFPSIRAKFRLDWDLTSADGFALTAPKISFDNVELNLGEFVNKFALPILEKVQEVLEPMKPILDFMATRIPVISDLKKSTYTIGDMLLDSGGVSDTTKQFIHEAHHLLDLFLAMKNIGKMADYWFPIGSFTISGDPRNDPKDSIHQTDTLAPAEQRISSGAPAAISAFINQTETLDDTGDAPNGNKDNSGFKFPIFDDPKILFGVLMGKDVSLVEYKMPEVNFKIAFEYAYPIYGYLMVFFRGGFGGKVNLTFGYDTHGLREFIDTKQPVDLLSGFYVKGGGDAPPIFSFFANISVGIKVEFSAANVGISGGFIGNFSISLNDPNKDGKVHVDEFIEDLSAGGDLSKKLLCTFQFTGKISFGLSLFVTAAGIRYELNFAEVPLWQFDTNAILHCNDFVPDRFDKVLDSNGTRQTATDIGVGPGQDLTGLNIGLGSDIDYYKFELVRPDSVDVKAIFRNGAGQIGFQVSDANKKLLGKSAQAPDGALLLLHDLKPGIYYIQVRGPKRGQPYDLAIVPAAESVTHVYYVNDSSVADQYYARAPGADSNDGLSPNTPKATVQSVLDTYQLQGNDMVVIDTGLYITSTTVSTADSQVLFAGTPAKTIFSFIQQPSFNVTGSGGNIFDRLNFQSTSTTAVAIVLTSSGASPPVGNQVEKSTFDGGGGAVRADAGSTLFEDNTITNTSSTALLLSGTASGAFHRNRISVKTGAGIQVQGTGDSELLNNTVKNTTTGGILLLNQARGTLKDNEIDATSGEGIAVLGSGNSLLQNNSIYATTTTAFRLGAGTYTLKQNTVSAFAGTGIRLEGGGTLDAEVNSMGGFDQVGIHLKSAASSKLLGNRIGLINAGQGILAETGAHQIESNIITGGARGIRLLATATLSQPLLSNSVTLGQGTHGIELDSTQAVEITSNTVANAGTYGIFLPASTGATIRNNDVTLSGGAEGIHLDAGVNLLDSNTVKGVGGMGIWLTAGASGPITNNIIKVQGLTYGIRYDSALAADIEKNASGTARTFGIYISNAATSRIVNNTVDLTGTGIGIRFEKGTGEITDNTITGTGDYGIFLSSTVKVSQGEIRRNNILNAANQAGLRLDSADPVTIEDNTVHGAKTYGIYLPASINSTLRNNVVATGYGGTPIRIEAGTVLIESNTLKTDSANGYGIDLAKTAFGTVRGNTLTGGGMRVEFGENLIENNNISGSRNGYNIHLNGTASGTIRGNTLPDAGIEVNGPVKVLIDNNTITTPGAGVSIRTATQGTLTSNHINNSGTGFELLSGLYDIENNVIHFSAEEGIYLADNTLLHPGTHIIRGNIISGVVGSTLGNAGMLLVSGDLDVENNVVEGYLDGIRASARTSTILRNNQVISHKRGIFVGTSPQQLVENNTVIGKDNASKLGDGIYMEFITNKTSSIVRHNDVSGFLNGINSMLDVQVYDNKIHDNITGTIGAGTVGRQDGATPNQIYNNGTGSNVFNGGVLWFNRIYDNKIGIAIGLAGSAFHNEVFRSSDTGVQIVDARDAYLWNNTIVGSTTAALSITGASNRLIIRNNIFSYTTGYGILVDVNIIGINSTAIDYNLFNPGPGAKIGSWNKTDCPTLAAWQNASTRDASSLVADPRFTNVAAGDFTLQAGSPAIDRGDAWYGARRDAPDGGRIDDPGTTNAGRVDYVARDLGQSLFSATGKAQNFHNNTANLVINLPWQFPIYDQQASFVNISTEGTIAFLNSALIKDPDNSTAKLAANLLIAPLWDNLNTNGPGDDVFIDTSVPDQFKIRWNATNEADNSDVQFSVTLFRDGHMRFDYGPGNTNLSPTIGLSLGNNAGYTIAPNDGSKTLTNANSIEFTLRPSYVDIGAQEYGAITLNNGQVQRSSASSLTVTFAQNVSSSLTVDDFVLKNQTTGATIPASNLRLQYDTSKNQATLTFANGRLPDGDYELTLVAAGITGPSGAVLDADVHYDFHVLAGDANGDGVVNDRDLLQVFQDLARPAAQRSLDDDVNGDGVVNNADLDFIRSHYLTQNTAPNTSPALVQWSHASRIR